MLASLLSFAPRLFLMFADACSRGAAARGCMPVARPDPGRLALNASSIFRRTKLRTLKGPLSAVSLALLLAFPWPAIAGSDDALELADIPFEQLVETEVVTASKLASQISDAPSAVSIVTAQDIRDFGYRNLGEILNSMRGLNVTHGSNYGFLGGRGYANPGDFSGVITLLIDGYRAPENVWGQIFLGNDGILDVELIERVEYIPGSGSSSHGDSAFLGVINIVTKKGADIEGAELSAGMGSHGWQRRRVAYGQKFENGLDLVLSASFMHQAGRSLSPEFGGASADHLYEKERNERYFLKAAYQGWTFESAWAKRPIDSSDLTVGGRDVDQNYFASLRHDAEISTALRSSIHLYFGHSRQRAYDPLGKMIGNHGGDWWGIDSKLVGNWFDRHTLVLGTEYRDDYRQRLLWDDEYGLSQDKKDRATFSVYAYDNVVLSDRIELTLGGRIDARDNGNTVFSPRTALIYTPVRGTTLKLSSGIAHRQPTMDNENSAELAGQEPRTQRLSTNELVWEQLLGPKTRLTSSLYRYRMSNYKTGEGWVDDPNDPDCCYVVNYSPQSARGVESELEYLWDNGVRLRTSYAWQQADLDNGQKIVNLARNIAKLNLSAPLSGEQLRAGLEMRYVSKHLNRNGGYDPETLIADLTLTSRWNRWFTTFAVRNLGNVSYTEIGRFSFGPTGSYGVDRRNYWLQIGYEFK